MAGKSEGVAASKPKESKQLSLLLIDDDGEFCSMMQEFFATQGTPLKWRITDVMA